MTNKPKQLYKLVQPGLFCFICTLALIFVCHKPVMAQEPEVIKKAVDVDSSSSNNLVEDEKDNDGGYGFSELWSQGDVVARITLVILLLMSIGTWTIFLSKFLDQRRIRTQAIELKSLMNQNKTSQEIMNTIETSRFEALRVFTVPVYESLSFSMQLQSKDNEMAQEVLQSGVQEGISEIDMEIQKGLTFLATVGSTAPFVGLFGTVWAIYHALIGIGLAGEATLDKVAGPVGEALIMTAIGLAVAVPAVLAYNWLLRRNKSIVRIITNVSTKIVYGAPSF